ncbi:MAG: glycine betaine ABC transporter substrate-binding protein, partial [Oscillospiraceae bacterium]|nr:glycine betaine ABC transporter substrate-binding protein [Oscillospiraceae bacterium]
MKLKNFMGLAIALVFLLSIALTGCSGGDKIVIGSKDFSENILLGEIFSQLIEAKTDIKVERKLNLGGT